MHSCSCLVVVAVVAVGFKGEVERLNRVQEVWKRESEYRSEVEIPKSLYDP